MTSINTNVSAMAALQNLQSVNSMLEDTQARISTGYKVGSAADNAAYWSIATTMRSDNKALGAVEDSLGIGAAQADVAYTALNATKDVLDEMKAKLVAAKQPGVDKAKVQEEIEQLQAQMQSVADSAAFNGDNWLKIDSSTTAYTADGATRSIVSSFTRSGSTVSVATIDITLATGTTNSVALYDANTDATAKIGILDTEITGTDTAGTTFTVGTLDVSTITDDADGTALLNDFISAVDDAIASVTTAASDIGSTKSRIEMQKEFTSTLMDSIDKGIGTLVDADMTEESTRLKALQTQQQLGVQALSIANASSQSLLSLFR